MPALNRRQFLGNASLTAGALVLPLSTFHGRLAHGQELACVTGFGPLAPRLPENAADLASTVVGDLSDIPLLDLPEGFRYTAFSLTGMTMSDGARVPGDHDGMACFRGPRGTSILVRNHELSPGENEFGDTGGVDIPGAARRYDDFEGRGGGGTTTLIVDRNGRLVRDFGSLAGTIRNCAGGPTPWGSWISCEENVSTPASTDGVTKKHGYNFEVPARRGARPPEPLIAMGRFNHEATATDPATGFVYQTEDRGDSAFYRFRPNRFARLREGGVLEALVYTGIPNRDTRSGILGELGVPMPVEWITIENVDPAEDTLRFEAQAKGAALFERGEGCWYGNGQIYFVCTSGGDVDGGQVFAYDPVARTITLVVESTDRSRLDRPDNITVAPDGTLYLCEDGGGEQFVVGVDCNGGLFPFARNALVRPDRNFAPDNSEFAGACFSPDGTKLFVNTQGVGITFCIWGPWQRGPSGALSFA